MSCQPGNSLNQPVRPASTLGVPLHINGRGPYQVSVDTGAGLTVVLPEIAEGLGLKAIGTEERRGVGGSVSIDLVAVERVSLCGVEIQLETLGVSPFLRRMFGELFQGNVGYDVLRHGRLIADYPRQRMIFEPSDPANPSDGVPFTTASAKKPLVIVEAMVNGTGPYRFAVDTGAMGTCVSPRLAETTNIGRGDPLRAAGVGGEMEAYFAARPLILQVGRAEFGAVKPVVLDIFGTLAAETDGELAGIIGQDVMGSRVVTFDYPHARVRFD